MVESVLCHLTICFIGTYAKYFKTRISYSKQRPLALHSKLKIEKIVQ